MPAAVGDWRPPFRSTPLFNYGDLSFKRKLYGVTIQNLSVSTLDGIILFEIHCKAVLGIFF